MILKYLFQTAVNGQTPKKLVPQFTNKNHRTYRYFLHERKIVHKENNIIKYFDY